MSYSAYFLKRLILIIPTFIGITLICFTLCQFVPGGPVEQAISSMRGLQGGGEAGAQTSARAQGVSEAQRAALIEHFGFDKPIYVRYWEWLVKYRVGMQKPSIKFPNKTTWELISSRFPVSLIFGLTGFLLSYLICIPLGIAKAIREGTRFDTVTSVIVFVGYAIPAFAFGMVLKMLLSGTVEGGLDWFPVSGQYSDGIENLGWWTQFKDQVWHMVLPVTCYVIGNFALLTVLMKNSLLEEISKDYVRTILAKGGTIKIAIWGHALRNALIPIATGLGSIMTLMFAGSVLIERVFEIPGMGNLGLEAAIGRDYPVFMGILALTSILGLLGRMVSDFCYVVIDPRVDFDK